MKDLKRFKEIIEEINDLVEEAYENLNDREKEKARGYWYASILTSLDDKHCFLSNCPYTMELSVEDSIKDTNA